MRLPPVTASAAQWIATGRYVGQRARRAGFDDLALPIEAAAEEVKVTRRIWEDLDEGAATRIADRDAADDVLDLVAQRAKSQLAARAADATTISPFVDVFPSGIGYYIDAGLADEVIRYRELADRLSRFLGQEDPVRLAAVPQVEAGVAAFEASLDELDAARRSAALARNDYDAAVEALAILLERSHGALLQRVGKRRTEGFFPKTRRGVPAAEEEDGEA